MGAAVSKHLFVGQGDAVGEGNERFDGLPQNGIRHTDNRSLSDAGEIVQHCFNFFGRYFFAPAFDDVIASPHEIEKPILVHSEQVSRVARAFTWSWSDAITVVGSLRGFP